MARDGQKQLKTHRRPKTFKKRKEILKFRKRPKHEKNQLFFKWEGPHDANFVEGRACRGSAAAGRATAVAAAEKTINSCLCLGLNVTT